jgi:hypothetical protein
MEVAKENAENQIGLRKELNIINCVSYLISMIIGAGIFIVPNVIYLKITFIYLKF